MTTKEKKHNRNRTQYRFGWYKQPSEHHGHPVFIKYRSRTIKYKPQADETVKPVKGQTINEHLGHVYILPTTYRRFLATLRRKAALIKNRRKQQLAHTLSSRN